MKLLRYLLAALVMISCVSHLFAADEQDGSAFDEELNERDFEALREYLKTKRAIDIADSPAELSLSGDIRTEWRHMAETCNGMRLRGNGATDLKGRPISRNDFDIEFNLYFNYMNERTWAVAHVRYDNSAGVDDNGHPCIGTNDGQCLGCKKRAKQCEGDPEGYHGSGAAGSLYLKKAYMGCNLYSDDDSRFDVELGRRGNLYNVFDSNVQFLSRLDGLVLKFDSSVGNWLDWYIHAAGFVVDERVNHFAYVAEVGLLNIAESRFDLKYSFINWRKYGYNRCFAKDARGFRFMTSQWTAIYNLDKKYSYNKPVKFFAALLWNPVAPNVRVPICDGEGDVVTTKNYGQQNLAWYAGVLIGRVLEEGDWAIEIQYQWVQAQAMPDGDAAGICRGNVLDESFTTCARAGNTNYKGWKIEGLYALTDNLTVDTILEWSKACNSHIGGRHTYSKLEIEAIYAF